MFFLIVAVATLLCCMGMDVNCDGEFQGLSCSFDGCGSGCGNSCNTKCNHSYKIIEEVKATCNGGGYVKSECTKCHAEKNMNTDPLGHAYEFVKLHRGICSTDEDEYTYGSWYDEFVCSRCNTTEYEYYYNGTALHYYDEGEVTSLDDCGCGEITYTCLICGYKDISYTHSDDSPQQAELNEKYGSKTCGFYVETCELCYRPVTKVWHNYTQEDYLVLPTETEYGLKKTTCLTKCTYIDKTSYYLVPRTSNK